MKAIRRTLFALPCIGILVTFYLMWTAVPYTVGWLRIHHREIEQYDDRQILLGLCSGAAMSLWCIVFRKQERLLTKVGFLLAILGVILGLDIRLVD
jgi:hypothetical protein